MFLTGSFSSTTTALSVASWWAALAQKSCRRSRSRTAARAARALVRLAEPLTAFDSPRCNATAVAGRVLGVNPFDQPDVQAAKDRTGQVLASGDADLAPYSSAEELFAQAAPGDYVSILAFVLMHSVPGGPFDETNQPLPPAAKENILRKYGLDRPNIVNPVVIYRMPPVVVPYPGRAALGPAYFPRDGMTPGYGRLEIVPPPNRPLPRPAQSYSCSWRKESAPTPADLPSNNPNTIAPVITPYVFPGAGPPCPPGPDRPGPRLVIVLIECFRKIRFPVTPTVTSQIAVYSRP